MQTLVCTRKYRRYVNTESELITRVYLTPGRAFATRNGEGRGGGEYSCSLKENGVSITKGEGGLYEEMKGG